jgi:hypothetical protein
MHHGRRSMLKENKKERKNERTNERERESKRTEREREREKDRKKERKQERKKWGTSNRWWESHAALWLCAWSLWCNVFIVRRVYTVPTEPASLRHAGSRAPGHNTSR